MILIQFVLLALADVLVKMALERGVKKALPAIFRRLDDELPTWLSEHLDSNAISGRIAQAIADAIGKPVSGEQVAAIVTLYDPRIAAAKAAAYIR